MRHRIGRHHSDYSGRRSWLFAATDVVSFAPQTAELNDDRACSVFQTHHGS